MGNENTGADRSVAAAERSLVLLEAFLDGGALTLSDLEARTGLFKSVILRYMISFEGRGFVRKGADGRYCLGPKAFQLGKAFESTFNMSSILQPSLDRLTHLTGKSASIYIREGDWRICWLRAEPDRSVRVSVPPGTRRPIDETASSLTFKRYEKKSSLDLETLSPADIAATAGMGDPLLASMAVPVFGPDNNLVGVMMLSGIKGDFDLRSTTLRTLLCEEAMAASRSLGATFSIR